MFNVDDRVMFGRGKGQKTLGEIVAVTRGGKFKVRQLERRGTNRSYAVGTVWTVPPSLCSPAVDVVPNTGGMSSDNYAEALNELGPGFVDITKARTFGFRKGDRVSFRGKRSVTVKGTVKRVNTKTVTVIPDNPARAGQYYRVSPGLLRKA